MVTYYNIKDHNDELKYMIVKVLLKILFEKNIYLFNLINHKVHYNTVGYKIFSSLQPAIQYPVCIINGA